MIALWQQERVSLEIPGTHGEAPGWRDMAELAHRALSGGRHGAPEDLRPEAGLAGGDPKGTGFDAMRCIRIKAPALRQAGIERLEELESAGSEEVRAGACGALAALSRLAASEAMRSGVTDAAILVKIGTMRSNPTDPFLLYGGAMQVVAGRSIRAVALSGPVEVAAIAIAIAATVRGGLKFGPVEEVDLRGSSSLRAMLAREFAAREPEDRETIARFMRESGTGPWAEALTRANGGIG